MRAWGVVGRRAGLDRRCWCRLFGGRRNALEGRELLRLRGGIAEWTMRPSVVRML